MFLLLIPLFPAAKREITIRNDHLLPQSGDEDGRSSSPSQLQALVIDVPFLSKVYPSDDIPNMAGSNCAEDTKLVKVGSYYVKPSLSTTLQAIVDKHGDIAKDCQLESDYMRTPVLEGICKVVQDLQSIQFSELKQQHLKSFYSAVKDAERVNLNVSWLHERLDQLVQAVNSFNLKDSKRKSMQRVESIKKALELKKVEMEEIQTKIQELEGQLASETLEEEILNITVTDITSKYEFFEDKCLTDGLL